MPRSVRPPQTVLNFSIWGGKSESGESGPGTEGPQVSPQPPAAPPESQHLCPPHSLGADWPQGGEQMQTQRNQAHPALEHSL